MTDYEFETEDHTSRPLEAPATTSPNDEEDVGTQESSQNSEEPPTPQQSTTETKIRTQVTQCLEKIATAQERATYLRTEANSPSITSEESKDLIRQAVEQEGIAASQQKIVKRLQSGVWQGGLAGGGIGTGIGMGIGTVLGTVVGGVASLPFGGLGMLGGAATGAVHGPWFLKKKKKDGEAGVGDEGGGEEDELVEVVKGRDGGLVTAEGHEKIVGEEEHT